MENRSSPLLPVPILMVYEPKSEGKVENLKSGHEVEEYFTQLVTSNCCRPRYTTVLHQVILSAMCKTAALGLMQAAGVVDLVPHISKARTHATTTAKDSMDAHARRPHTLSSQLLAGITLVYPGTRKLVRWRVLHNT